MKNIAAFIVLITLCNFGWAQPIAAPDAFARFMEITTGVGKQTIQFSSSGTPMVSPGVPTITTDGGMPRVDASGSYRNPSGNYVPTTATARVPAAEVAKSASRAFGRIAASSLPFVGIGLAIYDFGRELNYIFKRNPDGTLGVDKLDPAACTVSPCYSYSITSDGIIGSGSTVASAISSYIAAEVRWGYTSCLDFGPYLQCYLPDGSYHSVAYNRTNVAPSTAAPLPSTLQDFLDAVASKSGFPAGSAVRRVIAEDAPSEKLKVGTATVAGPATSTGTTTITNNTTNNTTKTETTTHNHTYEGPTVKTTTVTLNQTVNNATGAITESSTATGTALPAPAPAPVEPIIVCGLPTTPPCKIDETGTPSGVGTIFDAPKTEVDTVKTQAETAIAGAQNIPSPAWSFTFSLPTGCAPYVTGIKGFLMNICSAQPIIHDLLSMIWAAATAFALIGMVGRTIREA